MMLSTKRRWKCAATSDMCVVTKESGGYEGSEKFKNTNLANI